MKLGAMCSAMKRFLACVLALIMPALPAAAEPVVVELFASQNCPACPKAFRTLKSAAEKDDILVLTWSVDYWDYLADADPMAMPESTERQEAYVERFELRGPYTPQTVYDGAEECPGNKRRRVKHWIDQRLDTDAFPVTLAAAEGGVSVSGDITLPRDVFLVHYLSDYEGDMPNPVVKFEKLGQWSGGETVFATNCENACAVLVQETGTGEILSAMVMP